MFNFIDVVKNFRIFFGQHFWDFAQIFDKSKVLGARLHPQLLYH